MSSRERAAMRVTLRPVASIFSARWSTATLLGAATSTYSSLAVRHDLPRHLMQVWLGIQQPGARPRP